MTTEREQLLRIVQEATDAEWKSLERAAASTSRNRERLLTTAYQRIWRRISGVEAVADRLWVTGDR